MTRMVSIATKIRQIHGLAGSTDVSVWENEFIESIWEKTNQGDRTTGLSEKQVDAIDRIWGKHFS